MKIIDSIKSALTNADSILEIKALLKSLQKDIELEKIILGSLLSKTTSGSGLLNSIQEAEFKVFSQWGDDGIIQYLINNLDISEKRFIEFGVSNYKESNTRFLLVHNNWSGLVMDCSEDNVKFIMADDICWKYDLSARHAFVTVDNVNSIIADSGIKGNIGLLHIDVDGNDYWIWKAISVVEPVIAIIEYNSLFGIERAITIPYNSKFCRSESHHSGLYAGASLLALCDLAEAKGYCFVGSNSAGNNAYFIKKEHIGTMKTVTPEQGYVFSKFREHRDENGQLTFTAGKVAIKGLRGMKVFNTRTNAIEGL